MDTTPQYPDRGRQTGQRAERNLRIMLVGHHPLVRQSLRDIIHGEPDLEVVAEAAVIEDALVAGRALQPDVVILDVASARDRGVAALRDACPPEHPPRIVMVGMSADREHVMHALRAGACGYLRTQDAAEELVAAVRTASPARLFLGAAIEKEEIMAEVVSTQRKARVLVVEDDSDFVDIAKTALEAGGYEVLVANTKDDGLKRAREERPDAIILDVMMPEGTEGFHFVWELRQDPDEAIRAIPILVLSAIHERSQLRFYPDQGDDTYEPFEYLPVQEFVDKPVAPGELLEKVRRLVAGAPAKSKPA
ncbi:MAG: response regulator [Armatimonadota bacterium]|nr:MAG: response regulator [Armatimonadota bacterium]